MNRNEITGTWRQIKGKVKETWGKLSANDLMVIAGQRDQRAGAREREYGRSQGAADNGLGEFPQGLIPVTISKSPQRRP
jgi:uncharacterized protein YjbJ (UPF0337 family)